MSAMIFDFVFSFSFVKVERTAAKYTRDVHASQLMRFGESVFCAASCFGRVMKVSSLFMGNF